MKKCFVILSLQICVMIVNAQSIIKKVNDIKMSEDYIWAQYANPSPDSALVKAKEWLGILISEAENSPVSILELAPHIRHIYLKGETVTRAFVYIKKSDIHHKADTVKSPVPHKEDVYSPDSLTLVLLALKDIYAVRDYFENAVSQGSIVQYGSPKDVVSMDDKYLILFKKDGLVPICVLSPKSEATVRTNLLNGLKDSLENYHGYYAIWYELKEKSKKKTI